MRRLCLCSKSCYLHRRERWHADAFEGRCNLRESFTDVVHGALARVSSAAFAALSHITV
jgi:hypothetical protein